MITQEFINALRHLSDSELFEDIKEEWNYYTFRFEDNNCQICMLKTELSIIFHHRSSKERMLLICDICSNHFQRLHLIPSFKNILGVRDGRLQTFSKGLIRNACSIGVIDRKTQLRYDSLIRRKILSLEEIEFRTNLKKRICGNYIRNKFPSKENRLYYRKQTNDWVGKLYPINE